MSYKILVIDDHKAILDVLECILNGHGYDVECFTNANEALKSLLAAQYDKPHLILLDLMLEEMSGLEFLKILRSVKEFQTLPCIVVSCCSEEEIMLHCFKLQIDDFIQKPFNEDLVIARVDAVLRRSYKQFVTPEDNNWLRAGQICLNPSTHRVTVRGKDVWLTSKEFALLKILIEKTGCCLNRRYLLQAVWDMPESVYTRTLDTTVFHLREKLGPEADLIRTIPGEGYLLEVPSTI